MKYKIENKELCKGEKRLRHNSDFVNKIELDLKLPAQPTHSVLLLCGGKIQRYEEDSDDETDSEWEAEEN